MSASTRGNLATTIRADGTTPLFLRQHRRGHHRCEDITPARLHITDGAEGVNA
ncbi:MAG: hypothetical protein ACLSAP_05050 [Oscillospiraceae bacterium]